jgi:acetolactate synthase I/II/III large subunit
VSDGTGRRDHVPSGGELLVDVMRCADVDVAFGVVSVHNLPLVDAVHRHLRFVPVRHEAAAVNAADGYGRARAGIGVAVTSTGTGAGNAAGSLIESLTTGSPVLHITGQVPSEHLGSGRGALHETKDQLGMLTAVSKAAWSIAPGDNAGALLREAVTTALAPPRGPVSVEWPIDLQYGPQRDGEPGAVAPTPSPDPDAIRRAAELIARSRRPLLWLGGGGAGAAREVQTLVDRLGCGVLTSNSGRGVVREDDPRCVGNFASNPAAADLLSASDLLISVGTHFRSNETRDYTLDLPRPHVQIDVDPLALGRSYPCDVGIAGPAAEVLQRLLAGVDKPPVDPAWVEHVDAARTAVRAHLREGLGPQAELCDALRDVLPEDAVIARDVTIPSSYWGNRLLEVYDPRTNVFPRGGGIGQGVAMGIGAALGNPSVPVAVLVGDGGVAVHLGELLTLAQEQAWVTVILFNDGGYGVLRNMQDRYLGCRSGVDLLTPDFGGLCDAVGLVYERVTAVSGFAPAVASAVERRAPAVVEVDVNAIGPMPRPFIPPVAVPER